MSTVKDQVQDFIKTDRTMLGGINLYNKLPGKNLAYQRNLSRQPDTPQNLERLCYELCKLVGIPERNFKILMQQPVGTAKVSEKFKASFSGVDSASKDIINEDASPQDLLIAFNREKAIYKDALQLAKDLELTLPKKDKVTVYDALDLARAEAVKKK